MIMDPNTPGYPTMQHNTGYPVTSQNNPQQFSYYPSQIPSSFPQSTKPPSQQQQQQQQQQSFGVVPLQPGGPGGAMMPSGFPQHSPGGPHANFSAPFTQPSVQTTSMNQFFPPQATSASNLPTTSAQSFPQMINSVPANNMVSAQQPKAHPQQNPSQSPAQSSAAAARERDRVAVLLDINSMLLQEVMNLQSAGKAGGPSTQQGLQETNPSPTSDTNPDKSIQRSPEYVACMRRLQVNLAYLATIADRAKKSGSVVPPAPAIMTPPPNMPGINELYNKLNELCPRTSHGGVSQPSPQGPQGNGRPSPSPATDSTA